jgi:hypothetical protein
MKVLWIVLSVLGGLCLICGVGAFFLFNKGKAVFDETGKFGDDSFRAIATSWDPKEFDSRAAPEIAQQNGKNAIPDLLERLKSTLGPLKGGFTSHVTSFDSKNNNGVSITTATWIAQATFEKGAGSVTMDLVNRGDKWQILKFNVDSPLLTAAPTEDKSGTKNDEPNVPKEEPSTTG